jgi:hypothetical protein
MCGALQIVYSPDLVATAAGHVLHEQNVVDVRDVVALDGQHRVDLGDQRSWVALEVGVEELQFAEES